MYEDEYMDNLTINNTLSSIQSILYDRLHQSISYDYIKCNFANGFLETYSNFEDTWLQSNDGFGDPYRLYYIQVMATMKIILFLYKLR